MLVRRTALLWGVLRAVHLTMVATGAVPEPSGTVAASVRLAALVAALLLVDVHIRRERVWLANCGVSVPVILGMAFGLTLLMDLLVSVAASAWTA